MKNTSKISVIIPVYNVENYIDRCIESVVEQTFKNIEIICICGASQDYSKERCLKWSKRDGRIRCIRQSCGLLGTARNEAIQAAKSELITFIDGDDWWDMTILEKLYKRYLETDADMVMCNRYNVEFGEDGYLMNKYLRRELSMSDMAESVVENPNLICYTEVSVNGKLFKKSLFLDNNICQPDIFGEDRAIMYYLLTKCKRIGKVDEGLYYYHAARAGNSVCNIRTYETTAECMEYIRNLFVKEGLEKKYHFQLAWIYKTIADIGSSELKKAISSKDKELAKIALDKIERFGNEYYPEKCEKKWIWGSYNLRRIAEYIYPQKIDKRIHYAYSSIISVMASKRENIRIKSITDNLNQTNWLNADCQKTFWDDFYPTGRDILLIDFLEERFPIAVVGKSYVTYSPLFVEYAKCEEYICKKDMEERKALWEIACIQFIDKLKERIAADKVYLVKSKLAVQYGTMTHKLWFHNKENINKANDILEEYYSFFAAHYKGIHIVENLEDAYFYTDEDCKYGCYPWHLNEHYYFRQDQKVEN